MFDTTTTANEQILIDVQEEDERQDTNPTGYRDFIDCISTRDNKVARQSCDVLVSCISHLFAAVVSYTTGEELTVGKVKVIYCVVVAFRWQFSI